MRHACFSFYLSGLLGIGRAREVGAAGMNGGAAGPSLSASSFPAMVVLGLGDVCISPPGKERPWVLLLLCPQHCSGGSLEPELQPCSGLGPHLLSTRKSHPGPIWVYSCYSVFLVLSLQPLSLLSF